MVISLSQGGLRLIKFLSKQIYKIKIKIIWNDNLQMRITINNIVWFWKNIKRVIIEKCAKLCTFPQTFESHDTSIYSWFFKQKMKGKKTLLLKMYYMITNLNFLIVSIFPSISSLSSIFCEWRIRLNMRIAVGIHKEQEIYC